MRPIDADALIAQWESDAEEMEELAIKLATYGAINDVKRQPTIEPRKKGKWIRINNEPFADTFECSECGQKPLIYDFEQCLSNYCLNCGADLREGGEDGQ